MAEEDLETTPATDEDAGPPDDADDADEGGDSAVEQPTGGDEEPGPVHSGGRRERPAGLSGKPGPDHTGGRRERPAVQVRISDGL